MKNGEKFKINEMISIAIPAVKELKSEDRKITKRCQVQGGRTNVSCVVRHGLSAKGPYHPSPARTGAGITEATSLLDKGNSKGKDSVEASVPAGWQPTWQRKRTVHLLPP